ncbi:MAG: MFS transporter [Chloroflexi bacterium]|nr:MFS transporter [Chloroflexota bacterium]
MATMAGALAPEERTSLERRVIVSTSLAHAGTHALELVYAALLVRIGFEFGADLAMLGAVGNAGTLTFGLFALPSGWLVDRYGPRAVMTLSMGSAALFALVVALSPNLWLLAASLTLLGAGIGLYHPAGISMVATVASRRGIALATHGVAGIVGIAFAPGVAIGIAIATDWRIAYVAFAALAAGVAIVIWQLSPDYETAQRAAAESGRAAQAVPPARQRTTPPPPGGWFTRPLLLLYAAAVGVGFIYRGSLTFLAVHLERELGIELFGWDAEAIAGATASLALLLAVIGLVTGGWLSDRIALERAILPYAVVTPFFLFAMGGVGGVGLLLAATGFAICSWAQQPIMNGLIADYAPPGMVGRSFGVWFLLVFGVGSLASSVTGVVSERWGTGETFVVLAAVGVAVALLLLAVTQGAERRRGALEA